MERISLINEANFDLENGEMEEIELNEETRPSFFRRLLKCDCCRKNSDVETRIKSAHSTASQASQATLITMVDIEESENVDESIHPTVSKVDKEIKETANVYAKETSEDIEMDDVSKCFEGEPKDVSPEAHNSSEDEESITCDVIQITEEESNEIANVERESRLVPVEGPFSSLPLLERWNLLEEGERTPSPTSSSKSESHHSN